MAEISQIYIAKTNQNFDIKDKVARQHINNDEIHITQAERTKLNNMVAFSGDYNDLTNKPTGVLTIGNYRYDGMEDVTIPTYDGTAVVDQ